LKRQNAARYLLNKEKLSEQARQWKLNNPEKWAAYQSRYRQENREKIRLYFLNRRRTDPEYKLMLRLRKRLSQLVNGDSRACSAKKLLGCPLPEFRQHIEKQFRPGMSWENHGPVWHLDHIKPCAKFDLTDPEQQRECFHFSNFQPLFAAENLSKGAR